MKMLDVPQSGSIAGHTSSRNRFGQYKRTRAIPVNPNSAAQGVVRARMAANSQGWKLISAGQRAGWLDLAASMVRYDKLGQSYTMQPNQCYASINNTRAACGLAATADAPIVTAPAGLATVTVTLTAAAFSIAYTATPLATANYMFIFVSPQRSAGRNFEGDYRLLAVTAAAAASPHNALAAYTAKFGVPIVGNKIFISLVTSTLGFLGGPFRIAQVVA